MAWHWLSIGVIMAVHDEQIAEHGGSGGVRDLGLLSSALARPHHLATYDEPTVFELAAAYTFGIVQNHPFIDGNKRTGFLAAYIFLGLNGWKIVAPEAAAVAVVLRAAQRELDESGLALWFCNNSKQIKPNN